MNKRVTLQGREKEIKKQSNRRLLIAATHFAWLVAGLRRFVCGGKYRRAVFIGGIFTGRAVINHGSGIAEKLRRFGFVSGSRFRGGLWLLFGRWFRFGLGLWYCCRFGRRFSLGLGCWFRFSLGLGYWCR